jgi:hypothetical protein
VFHYGAAQKARTRSRAFFFVAKTLDCTTMVQTVQPTRSARAYAAQSELFHKLFNKGVENLHNRTPEWYKSPAIRSPALKNVARDYFRRGTSL